MSSLDADGGSGGIDVRWCPVRFRDDFRQCQHHSHRIDHRGRRRDRPDSGQRNALLDAAGTITASGALDAAAISQLTGPSENLRHLSLSARTAFQRTVVPATAIGFSRLTLPVGITSLDAGTGTIRLDGGMFVAGAATTTTRNEDRVTSGNDAFGHTAARRFRRLASRSQSGGTVAPGESPGVLKVDDI